MGKINLLSQETIDNAGFFFRIQTVGNVAVTRMDTSDPIAIKGGENTFSFKWDVSQLIPGKYLLDIALTQRNSWGNVQILDYINEAYCFEIMSETEDPVLINWTAREYGYYIGPEILLT